MEISVSIEIIEEEILKYGQALMDILLKDRTTDQNIIWATNDYEELGEGYEAHQEIKTKLLIDKKNILIQPRTRKNTKKQSNRTREMAEVFTPSWICNEQNNLIDEQWFGRKDIFNIQRNQGWQATTNKIVFPEKKGYTWKDYVDARRMEIACGEAPYLVSRYDTVTGEFIDLKSRIGLLDRKMRVINENVDDEQEWLRWSERAFQSVYGYEYQGDNLFLARENLLYTFIDNVQYKFGRKPSFAEVKRIAIIISWNIWQMNGVTGMIPLYEKRGGLQQMTLFDDFDNIKNGVKCKYCKIKNWRSRSKEIIEYKSMIGENR